MPKWLFWRTKKPEGIILEVDPDDEDITDAHIAFSEDIEHLHNIIAILERENEELKLENEQLRNIIKMGESKA